MTTSSETPNTDPRSRRMVTMQVGFEIEGAGLRFEGHSTGLNENGIAGRLNLVEGELPENLANWPVRIRLDLPREEAFKVIEGHVIRAEASWVPGYKYFVAVAFDTVDAGDIAYLKKFVQWRETRYFQDVRPPRTWYLFSNREQKQYGPLTTEEVLVVLRKGTFSSADLIWSHDKGEWVPFSADAILVRAAQDRSDRLVRRMAAALLVITLGGGVLGYTQGWLDYGSAARGFREGNALFREGNLHLATQRFSDVIRYHPTSRWAELSDNGLRYLRREMKRIQDRQVAAERLTQLKLIPEEKLGHPLILNNFGDCHFQLGDYPKALDYFTQALAKDPESRRIRFNIGTTYLRMGNPDAALSHFERISTELTNRPELHLNVGMAHLAKREHEKAMAAFDHAVRLDPEDQELKQTIAFALELAP
jgi:tetratricopeptide (TPR) repeat protein